jgi:alkylation response protein AidB-like acyl-CoA dehydrogenase
LSEAHSLEDASFAIAIAKARRSEAAGTVAAICHQAHRALGFTQECPLDFTTRRLWSWRDEGGSETHWQAKRIGRSGLAAPFALVVVSYSGRRSSMRLLIACDLLRTVQSSRSLKISQA